MDLQTLLAGSLRAIHRLGYKVDLVQEQPAPNSDALILPLGGAWLVITDMSETPAPESAWMLKALAEQMTLIIQQTQRYEDLQAQAARQTVLNEIAQTISQHLEMEDLFSAVTEQIQQIFPFRRASIILREDQRSGSRIFALSDQQDADLEAMSPLEEIGFQQVLRKQPAHVHIVSDLSQESEQDSELMLAQSELAQTGVRSYACLPLTMFRQVIASFNLASDTPGTFQEADSTFLAKIADHMAGAVWNALLYEVEQQRRHTADALAQLSKIVNSTLELKEVLELALEQLRRVITYDSASILLFDSASTQLTITAAAGFAEPEKLIGLSFQLEEKNISHQVMLSRQSRVVEDVQRLPEWGHNRDDMEGAHTIRGWIGAPLIVRGQSIGLLAIDKFEPNFYTDEDRETANAFAAQIATAIHNARLFQGMQEQRNKLSAILNDTSDAVIVLDHENRVWLVNPAAAHYLRIDPNQAVGQPASALNLPDLNEALEKVCETNGPVMREFDRDETAFQASITPVRDVGIVIVMQDITPLKQLDRLRTEWVAAVSHDLKNPIQVVQLGAVLLEMDGPLNELQLDRILIIQRSASQLSDLVTNVLDLARLEAGPSLRLAPVDVGATIEETLTTLEHLAARKEQQIKTEISDPLPDIQGDRALLGRVIANLVSNAIKYTPDGGTISVRARHADPVVEIEVSDDGPGIPAEAVPHLFDRFYRVPGTVADGTGLGLSIVKSIVEKHRGSIEVSSAPGEGSTFTLRLPVA